MIPSVYRVRVNLKVRSNVELHAHHAPVLYAVLSQANGRSRAMEPTLPSGLMLDVPEQCRVQLRSGDDYAFGFTLIAGSSLEATARTSQLIEGLHSLGERKSRRGGKFGGNFRVLLRLRLKRRTATHVPLGVSECFRP